MTQHYPKRLIEVDLPIKRVSAHASREKSIRHGHISTLHIWWARRPLAACRAVICAALWPDPADPLCPQTFRDRASVLMNKFAEAAANDRTLGETCAHDTWVKWQALFKTGGLDSRNETHWNVLRFALLDFVADFSDWDNSTVKEYLETSRALTQAAHESLGGEAGTRPLVVDPFAGGGSIPLEALRVGADAFASDLNPVPVLLNKVLVEYIPKYGQCLAGDVRRWGSWVVGEAEKKLAEFYPKDADGAKPIAYLWARTIQCEGPGCGTEVPLIRSLWLSKRQSIALEMKPQPKRRKIEFELKHGATEKNLQSGTVKRGTVTCPCCGFTISRQRVESQIKQQKVEPTLLAVVLESLGHGKRYRLPTPEDRRAVTSAKRRILEGDLQNWIPDEELPYLRSIFNVHIYGINKWSLLFDAHQKLVLATLTQIISELSKQLEVENRSTAKAVSVCLALAVDRLADFNSNIARWRVTEKRPLQHLAGRR